MGYLNPDQRFGCLLKAKYESLNESNLVPTHALIFLNSGKSYSPYRNKKLQFGETSTQLASCMEYMFRRKEWNATIGFEHWYVAENEGLDDEMPQSEEEKEDSTRLISFLIQSNGIL